MGIIDVRLPEASVVSFGLATPTGAGAAAALAIAAARRTLGLKILGRILGSTAHTTAMFVLPIVSGMFTSFVLARLGIALLIAFPEIALALPRMMLR